MIAVIAVMRIRESLRWEPESLVTMPDAQDNARGAGTDAKIMAIGDGCSGSRSPVVFSNGITNRTIDPYLYMIHWPSINSDLRGTASRESIPMGENKI